MNGSQQPQIKRFVASNMRRALDLVRAELGPEAVILSSQKVDDGVEIITSVERDLATRGVDDRREFGEKFDQDVDSALPSDGAWSSTAGIEQAAAQYDTQSEINSAGFLTRGASPDLAAEIEKARERMFEAKRRAESDPWASGQASSEGAKMNFRDHILQQAAATPELNQNAAYSGVMANNTKGEVPGSQQTAIQSQALKDDIARLTASKVEDEKRLQGLQSELEEMRMLLEQQLWRMTETTGSQFDMAASQQIKFPSQHTVIEKHLERLGLSQTINERLRAQTDYNQRVPDVWRSCMAKLSKMIDTSTSNVIDEGGVFAFVGQTGVGKTTTIAKLAAQYLLKHGPGKVALVTTDTYRVGAVDQLRSIGRIINAPVRVVDSANSLLTILVQLREYPLVLVDTAGLRMGDALLKQQMAQLDTCAGLKKLLVVSSTSQLQTMKASMHAYSSSKPIFSSVLTKLDEAASLGDILSLVLEQNLPVSYFTDGQEIPKDINAAQGHALVAKAVALMKNTAAQGFAGAGSI